MTWPGLRTRLEGERIMLEPLAEAHFDDLSAASRDERIWRWLPFDGGASEGAFVAWFRGALTSADTGKEVAFATLEAETGRAVGSTRYLELRPEHRRLEIGATWVTPALWSSGVNAEAKLLMLAHAFERFDCMRVEFKTHPGNERSRAALAALPARFEGILRKHVVLPGGAPRDSAYYSIVDDEWPGVRANLERRLARRPG
jgi:N-acetyltransferase